MYLIKTESYNSEEPIYMKLYNGENSLFVPEARVAKDYFNTGLYEKGFINWSVENFAKSDKEIIDVGAHIGMYTIEFAKKAKRVHSFECSPKSFNYLCANIALRQCDYVVNKYNVGLSDHEGSAKYYIRDSKDGGGNGITYLPYDTKNNVPTIEVPIKKLDSFGLTNINFIKIDVEGHEENVIRGAEKTLVENDYPKILFESWPERMDNETCPAKKIRESLFSYIRSLEYKIVPLSTDDMFLAERSQ